MIPILIGERIKELRKKKGYTLVELAKLTGVQVATLSRIENNKMTGTVTSHHKLAYILGVDITELYKDIDKEYRKEDSVLLLGENPEIISKAEAQIQTLIKDSSSKLMVPMIITLDRNGTSTKEHYASSTEAFVYVLSGSLIIQFKKSEYTLKQNEAIYFSASEPHYFKNLENKETKLLYVRTK